MMSKRSRTDEKIIRDGIDRISMLPDEILDCILSRLSLKEAISTSILSSRWRYLWTFLSKLDFDSIHFESWKKENVELSEHEANWKSKYVRGVNYVLALHKKESIEKFRIQFPLDMIDSRWIYKCVRFALAKKVEKLELELFLRSDDAYAFPFIDRLGADSDLVGNFKFLRTVSTKLVDVSGEALELLLCNSPLLEDLCVCGSEDLSTLRVIRPFPSLKRLEIRSCCNLKSVEICDSNLVYLKYEGQFVPFILRNVPLLINLHYGSIELEALNDLLPMFASILPQLETFMVDFNFFHDFSVMETPVFREHLKRVEMNKLKQLVVGVKHFDDDEPFFNLLPFVNLTAASPFLEKFVIKSYRSEDFDPQHDDEVREIKTFKMSYSCLRELEFDGYCGITSDLELIMHFLHNATVLEKIVVNTCNPGEAHLGRVTYDSTRSFTDEEETKADSTRESFDCEEMDAIKKQLTDIVPPKIQLKILGPPVVDESILESSAISYWWKLRFPLLL